ncbi:MAG TPA: phosphatidylglycerophosphatase A, partial [bacterium]|nr:phosphatidylglycerophosphatase A [bacterium]
PAGKSQDLKGGWGVMLDDVVAGIYAAIVLRLLLRFLPGA